MSADLGGPRPGSAGILRFGGARAGPASRAARGRGTWRQGTTKTRQRWVDGWRAELESIPRTTSSCRKPIISWLGGFACDNPLAAQILARSASSRRGQGWAGRRGGARARSRSRGLTGQRRARGESRAVWRDSASSSPWPPARTRTRSMSAIRRIPRVLLSRDTTRPGPAPARRSRCSSPRCAGGAWPTPSPTAPT
jgi:hypothetical protein